MAGAFEQWRDKAEDLLRQLLDAVDELKQNRDTTNANVDQLNLGLNQVNAMVGQMQQGIGRDGSGDRNKKTLIGKSADPGNFGSQSNEHWRAWSTKFKIYAGSIDKGYDTLLHRAEDLATNDKDVVVTMDEVEAVQDVRDAGYLARQLYASLIFHTTGEAQKMVENVPQANGVEAWRRLVRRWDPASAQAGLSLMNAILFPIPAKKISEMPMVLEKWDAMVAKQERRTRGIAVTDSTKMAIVIRMCPPELAKHLRINSQAFKTYEEIRMAIQQYVESEPITMSSANQAPVPMDLDACTPCEDHNGEDWDMADGWDLDEVRRDKGKGKGKVGKGDGKQAGKGGKAEGKGFKGECWNCGKTGHRSFECRAKKVSKGGGKGKGRDVNAMDSEDEDLDGGDQNCIDLFALDEAGDNSNRSTDPWVAGDDPWIISFRTKHMAHEAESNELDMADAKAGAKAREVEHRATDGIEQMKDMIRALSEIGRESETVERPPGLSGMDGTVDRLREMLADLRACGARCGESSEPEQGSDNEDADELDPGEDEDMVELPGVSEWVPLGEGQEAWEKVDDDEGEWEEIMPVHEGNDGDSQDGVDLEIGMDSCAAECVIPPGLVDAPVTESEGSKRGVFYRGAGGDKIYNEGEQRVEFFNENGQLMAMNFQVARVTKPLASLLKMTKKGNRIVLDEDGSYVVHKPTGVVTPIREKRGVFVMRVRVRGRGAKTKGKANNSGFARLGN